MARNFGDDAILSTYLDTFARAMNAGRPDIEVMPSREVPHV